MLRHWGFAVFLLIVPIPMENKSTNTLSRQRRSISHAQMMHDRSRSLQERKRRLWIQQLLEQVHTAKMWDLPNHIRWSVIHPPKYTSGTKNVPVSFQLKTVRMRDDLPQETSKTLRYEEQPLKSVMKRKRSKRDLCRKMERPGQEKRLGLYHPKTTRLTACVHTDQTT